MTLADTPHTPPTDTRDEDEIRRAVERLAVALGHGRRNEAAAQAFLSQLTNEEVDRAGRVFMFRHHFQRQYRRRVTAADLIGHFPDADIQLTGTIVAGLREAMK